MRNADSEASMIMHHPIAQKAHNSTHELISLQKDCRDCNSDTSLLMICATFDCDFSFDLCFECSSNDSKQNSSCRSNDTDFTVSEKSNVNLSEKEKNEIINTTTTTISLPIPIPILFAKNSSNNKPETSTANERITNEIQVDHNEYNNNNINDNNSNNNNNDNNQKKKIENFDKKVEQEKTKQFTKHFFEHQKLVKVKMDHEYRMSETNARYISLLPPTPPIPSTTTTRLLPPQLSSAAQGLSLLPSLLLPPPLLPLLPILSPLSSPLFPPQLPLLSPSQQQQHQQQQIPNLSPSRVIAKPSHNPYHALYASPKECVNCASETGLTMKCSEENCDFSFDLCFECPIQDVTLKSNELTLKSNKLTLKTKTKKLKNQDKKPEFNNNNSVSTLPLKTAIKNTNKIDVSDLSIILNSGIKSNGNMNTDSNINPNFTEKISTSINKNMNMNINKNIDITTNITINNNKNKEMILKTKKFITNKTCENFKLGNNTPEKNLLEHKNPSNNTLSNNTYGKNTHESDAYENKMYGNRIYTNDVYEMFENKRCRKCSNPIPIPNSTYISTYTSANINTNSVLDN